MLARVARIALVLLVVFALNAGLSHWYRERVMADGITERTLAQFEAERAGVRVVALGDSHVKWGLAPNTVPGLFNFAIPGETYAQSYYRLKSLLDAEALPVRTVILAADPHSLERKRRPDQPFLHYYARFTDLYAIGRSEGRPLFGWVEGLRGRFAPYVAQRANLLLYLATGQPPETSWLVSVPMQSGSLYSERVLTRFSSGGRKAMSEERIRFHFGEEPAIDPTLAEYLDRILTLCDERGVRALFVRFPLSGEYVRALSGVVDVASVDRHIAQSVEGAKTAELLDARNAFASQPRLFADVDHLNRAGATRLSRLIARRLAR